MQGHVTQKEALELIDHMVTGVMSSEVPLPYGLRSKSDPSQVVDVKPDRAQARGAVLALTLCNPVALTFGRLIETEMRKV